MERISWESFFMEQAVVFSQRATCNRLKVGCVITKDNLILSEGYNGSISGQPHCTDVGCLKNDLGRCIRTVHAEQNAIINAMKKGVSIEGGTAYVTAEPCEACFKLLLQSGVTTIVFLKPYRSDYAMQLMDGMNHITLREYTGSDKQSLLERIDSINAH